MSTNDPNERFMHDKDGRMAFDSEAAADSELSQDELDNVSGGLRAAMKDQQPDGLRIAFEPDGKATAARPSDDPSDALAR